MESNTNLPNDSIFTVHVDHEAASSLKTIASWARVIAIIAFCSAGLGIIQAFVGTNTAGYSRNSAAAMVSGAVFMVIVAAISVVINMFLLRFANRVLTSLRTMNQAMFNDGINQLRTYFKIISMIFILILSLAVLAVIFVMIGQAFV